jgi:hypothetical protein
VIVILGDYYNKSKWMQFEVTYAKQKKLPVIGICPINFPSANSPFPQPDKIIPWDKKLIIQAIRNTIS